MADDDPGQRRPGPTQKLSWTSILRKTSSAANDGGTGGEGTDSPKGPSAVAQNPVNRPGSIGAVSLRAGLARTGSNTGLLAGASGGGQKDGATPGAPLTMRSHSVVRGGLLAPGQGNGTAADVVTAVKDLQLRKRSIMFQTTTQSSPGLQTRTGSLSTYFFAPNPTPGKGVCFSPNGAYVMRWGYGTDVKLLSADDGMLVVTMVVPTPGAVRYATFNNDGSKLAVSTEDCKVYVWVTANKQLINMLDVGAEPLAHVVFSRDSKHLLSSDDEGQLEFWNIQTASMARRYETGHISKRCGFSADGGSVLSCAGDDCGLVMLNTQTGTVELTQLFEEVAESRNRACYVMSPDGTKVLLYVLEQVYGINLVLYHTDTDAHIPMMVCDGAVTHADFSNDSSLFITAGRDDLIHVWESDTGMLRTTLVGHASDVMFCKISEDGEVAVSGDSEGTVLVWSLADSACVMRLQMHSSPIACVDINADGTRALTVDTEGHALLWFLDVARVFEVMRQHSDLVCCVAPTPDGSSLIVGYKDGCLRCWNVCDGPGLQASVTWTHNKQACPVEQLIMRPDGAQVAAAGRDGNVVITDIRRGLVLAVLHGHNDFVTGLLFSERSDLLVTASRVGEVFVWDARSYGNLPLHQLEVPELTEVASLAISPNQAFLAAATAGGSVHVWSLRTFALQADVKVTDLPATRLTFNADASVLAVGSADGSVTLVDPLTGIRAAYYKGNASSIDDVAFMAKPEHILLSLCGRQAIKWDCRKSAIHHVTDFIADNSRIFSTESIGTMQHRTCVAHDAVVLYDPVNHAAMYDMLPRPPEQHPGNSYLFRHGTTLTCGPNGQPMVLFCAPDTTVHMLSDETGGTRCLDFSSDGRLLVSGTLRGELCVWDVVHQQLMHKWTAHKRYSITCVRFTHDATNVYSCAEDCKVIMWDWRRQTKLATLTGHQAPVQAVEMSVDGNQMASGDRDGFIFIWDTVSHMPKQVIPAHEGSVLCCSLSPCGNMVASTGTDEHIVILDVHEGKQLAILDDAMDGKGLTIKFSFDGTRLLVGGEKGGVLIWDVARNCLWYDIPAHDGKVFDCCWSGDSRRLLSVGSDGKARLWDAAAGSELCQANFDRVMGAVESGGFLHCDLSATGNRMAGCTAKGQLIDWDVGAELRCVPEGSMLYQRLSALSLGRSREVYSRLLHQFPLLPNTQDSRGWNILMHAVANSNPEITKLIISSVPSSSGKLGLTASAVQNSILSSIRHVPRVHMQTCTSGSAPPKAGSAWEGSGKRASLNAVEGSSKVLKLGTHSSAVSSKKLIPNRRGPNGEELDDLEEEDEDEDERDSDIAAPVPPPPPLVAGATAVVTTPAATAPAAGTTSSPTGGSGANLLGRMGSFIRTSAELLTPGRERTTPTGGDGAGTAAVAAAAAAAAAAAGVNAAVTSPQASGTLETAIGDTSRPATRSPKQVLVLAADTSATPGPSTANPASSSATPASGATGGSSPPNCSGSILKTRTASSPSNQAAVGSTPAGGGAPSTLLAEQGRGGIGGGSGGSASVVGGSVRGGNAYGASVGSASYVGGSVRGGNAYGASVGSAGYVGGSVRGGNAYGGTTKRSLLGSVLEAERERDFGTRSRRRSLMFGGNMMPPPGSSGGSAGPSNLGRSIRHAMHRLTRAGSRSPGGSGNRDLEEGAPAEENVEVRHVSDLSRNGWQEDDPNDPNRGSSRGPGGNDGAGAGQQSGPSVRGSNKIWPEPQSPDRAEPNVIRIALDAGAADCVQHVLDAVLAQKVTPGSYHAITAAIPAVAQQYPTMCQVFLSGLPLRRLGEMEVPSSIAARGLRVVSAPSYTSYKEMWMNELNELGGQANKGPMALMEACMVRLPFAAASGKSSVLHTLVESSVPVQTFGCDTVQAIVDYKWRNFAQSRIYIKALVYLLYTVIFTVFAVLFADDESTVGIRELYDTKRGIAMVAFAVILFIYGIYFLVLEFVQLASLGAAAYFDSFWNIVDVVAYVTTLVVCPCTIFRYGIGEGQFVPVLVAAEVIMLWIKVLFFGLAIDGVGTFIFMTAEIFKGLKYFIGMLATFFISFAVAFMVLFRNAPVEEDDGSAGPGGLYGDLGNALLNVYVIMFSVGDPHYALGTEYGHFAIFLFCVYMFALLVVMLNMIITLMADIFQRVKGVQHFVFVKGRAELIIDVESTTGASPMNADHPYLHLLMPLRKDAAAAGGGSALERATEESALPAGMTRHIAAGAAGGAGGVPGGGGAAASPRALSLSGGLGRSVPDGTSGSASDDDDGHSVGGGLRVASRMASFKSIRSLAVGAGGAQMLGSAMVGGGGALTRRQTEAFGGVGGLTMLRRGGGGACAAATAAAVVEADRFERLERAVNRLATNLEAVMGQLKMRRQSNSGPLLAPTESGIMGGVGGGAQPSARRGGGGNQRSSATGLTAALPVGHHGLPSRGGLGTGGSFGLPGSIASRTPSRPTSALAVMSAQHPASPALPPSLPLPPPAVVTHLGLPVPAAVPAAAAPPPALAPHVAGPAHAHLHATFADQYGSYLTVTPDVDAGARASGNIAGARTSNSGTGGVAVAVVAGVASTMNSSVGNGSQAASPTGGGSAACSVSGAAAAQGGSSSGVGGGPPRRGYSPETGTGELAATARAAAGAASPNSARLSDGASFARMASTGSVRGSPGLGPGSAAGLPSPPRSGGSAGSGGGGVAAAARLVLDPEEPQRWGGSGPGRPNGGGTTPDPARVRPPGEVEPSS